MHAHLQAHTCTRVSAVSACFWCSEGSGPGGRGGCGRRRGPSTRVPATAGRRSLPAPGLPRSETHLPPRRAEGQVILTSRNRKRPLFQTQQLHSRGEPPGPALGPRPAAPRRGRREAWLAGGHEACKQHRPTSGEAPGNARPPAPSALPALRGHRPGGGGRQVLLQGPEVGRRPRRPGPGGSAGPAAAVPSRAGTGRRGRQRRVPFGRFPGNARRSSPGRPGAPAACFSPRLTAAPQLPDRLPCRVP